MSEAGVSVITRRSFVVSVAGLHGVGRILGQTQNQSLAAASLGSIALTVSDAKRSLEFYQALFGMPVQSHQDSRTCLRIGSGPEFVALREAPNEKPRITHFGLTVDRLNLDVVKRVLGGLGIADADAPEPLRVHFKTREAGSKLGTPEVYVGDPDGVVVQIQDKSDCGGSGPVGEICSSVEPSPRKGVISLRDLSHVTVFVSDVMRSTAFYRDLFAMPIQANQGPSPLLAVGLDRQFLTIVGPASGRGRGGTPTQLATINHASFRTEHFQPQKVLKLLQEAGIQPRGEQRGPTGPLKSYITMRMPDRGGARDGTAELYFTDPDGILLQIQDVSYCGGSGTLGEICP